MIETTSNVMAEVKTILIVEDEELLREIERSILEGCGYRVLDAASGNRALEVWAEERGNIDLLLTDVVLPRGISGLELARRLVERKAGLKVVFTTGRALRDLEGHEKINAHFLQKPYQQGELIQVVTEALKAP